MDPAAGQPLWKCVLFVFVKDLGVSPQDQNTQRTKQKKKGVKRNGRRKPTTDSFEEKVFITKRK